jgi:hypothetical protein
MKTHRRFPRTLYRLWIAVFALFPFLYRCEAEKSSDQYSDYTTPRTNAGAVSGSGGTNFEPYSSGGSGGTGAVENNGGISGTLAYAYEICEGEEFLPDRQVAVMILQDLSFSLTANLDGKPKWNHAREALTSILTDPDYKLMSIRFGFDYFPDTTIPRNPTTNRPVYGCGVDDPVVVDADLNTESQIIDWINAHEPDGATPLHCALNKFTDPNYAPKFFNADIDKYLLLISDGADACGADCVSNEYPERWAKANELAEVAGRLLDLGIRIIVIGFGTAVAPDELNAISQVGGVFDEYLDAYNAEDLKDAFRTIICHL